LWAPHRAKKATRVMTTIGLSIGKKLRIIDGTKQDYMLGEKARTTGVKSYAQLVAMDNKQTKWLKPTANRLAAIFGAKDVMPDRSQKKESKAAEEKLPLVKDFIEGDKAEASPDEEAADKATSVEKETQEKAAAEKAAAEKESAEKAAAEKEAAEKAAAEKEAAEKAAAEKEAAEKAAAEKEAAEKAAAEKEAAEKVAAEKEADEKAAAEKQATQEAEGAASEQ